MDETPSLDKLAEALAKAQGQIDNASKSKLNPHFKSRYADLASIWDACREALSANGLSIVQRVSTTPDAVTVTTWLLHSSGQWMRDRCSMPTREKTPQAIGSAITYARRYSLAAMVGVAADDDDAEAAQGRAVVVPPPANEDKPKPQKVEAKKEGPTPYERIVDLGKQYGKDAKELFALIKKASGKTSSNQLTEDDVSLVDAALKVEAALGKEQEQ